MKLSNYLSDFFSKFVKNKKMSKFELKLPPMGESVAEATITSWLKNVGDKIEMDEPIVEIATDKVDTELPSEVDGTLIEILFDVDSVVKVGETIAIIETSEEITSEENLSEKSEEVVEEIKKTEIIEEFEEGSIKKEVFSSKKFFSPLVKNIAKTEGISVEELETIEGTGKESRVTKNDILKYLENRNDNKILAKSPKASAVEKAPVKTTPTSINSEDEIIEMTRLGKIISNHMIGSVQTSAHVQSFIEVDVTDIVEWRDKIKDAFFKREGEKITYTPIFIQAVAKVLRNFPMINISVSGDKIIKKKNINIGMATALPDGNLIVPVIKNADQLNLLGMIKAVNKLANDARLSKLKPEDIQEGTYTVTNIGSFGSIFGTPIINQPQVGILALGVIRKVPAVIETSKGDFIGIRHKMFISHSYDHRVVNGALGGQFIQEVKNVLESWNLDELKIM